MGSKYQLIARTNVTGLSHHNYALHAKQIEVGDELDIKRDVGNKFDDNAVKVLHEHAVLGEEQIGWLAAGTDRAKGQKSVVAKLLDASLDLKCVVISHDREVGRLDERLYVGVFLGVAAD